MHLNLSIQIIFFIQLSFALFCIRLRCIRFLFKIKRAQTYVQGIKIVFMMKILRIAYWGQDTEKSNTNVKQRISSKWKRIFWINKHKEKQTVLSSLWFIFDKRWNYMNILFNPAYNKWKFLFTIIYSKLHIRCNIKYLFNYQWYTLLANALIRIILSSSLCNMRSRIFYNSVNYSLTNCYFCSSGAWLFRGLIQLIGIIIYNIFCLYLKSERIEKWTC